MGLLTDFKEEIMSTPAKMVTDPQLVAIALVGVAPAIANAVYHATGQRIRDLPITLDKLL